MKQGWFSFLVFLAILLGPVAALNFGGDRVNNLLVRGSAFLSPANSDAELTGPASEEPAQRDPVAWLDARPDLRDLFISGERTPARAVIIEEVISTDDLFAQSAERPPVYQTALYAAARAPARLSEYCVEVVQTIGLSCDLIHTDTYQSNRGDWVMTGRLAYDPAMELGDIMTVENGQLFRTKISLPFQGDLRPENVAASRAAMLTQAQEICARIRIAMGNCVLTNVTFAIQALRPAELDALPAGTNPQRVEASAEFTIYADALMIDQDSYEDRVAALVTAG